MSQATHSKMFKKLTKIHYFLGEHKMKKITYNLGMIVPLPSKIGSNLYAFLFHSIDEQ